MITPYAGKEVLPYLPTCIDIETAPDGTVIGVGFVWSDGVTNTYNNYDTISEWYRDYVCILGRYKRDKEVHKRITRVYAHNGANFDYLSFCEYFSDVNEITEAQYFMADSTGIGLQVKFKSAGTVVFLDSYRLLPQSLAALTKTFNVEHIKQEVPGECKNNYLLFKTRYPVQFWQYLEYDVRGLQQVVYAFWERLYSLFGNVGHLPMTLPAVVLRVFTKQLKADIYTPSQEKLKQLERDSYKGGLTLCIHTGIYHGVNVYDVNSMYPYAMREHRYPVSYMGYWSNEYDSTTMGLWRAVYNQTRRTVPPILFDAKSGASYSGSGVYTTNELNYLAHIGGEFTVSEGYVYIETDTLFKEFIQKVYTLRKAALVAGDDALAYVLKIFMNSLYGKFAQREEGNKIILASADKMIELLEQGTPYKVMGNWLLVQETREVKHAFVAIAAMITANARIDLHTRMVGVIDSGYQVYYCDTDSIHTNGTFTTSNELGGIKLEHSDTTAYAGRKLYAFKNGKVKAKGIGRNITRGTLSYETIARLALDKGVKEPITFTTAPSVKGVLGQKHKAAVWHDITRNIQNTGGIWD